MYTNERKTRLEKRLTMLQESLATAEKSDALSIYGEYGEYMFIPLDISRQMKTALVKAVKQEIENLKLILK